jgi:putative ABC transport system permease protein
LQLLMSEGFVLGVSGTLLGMAAGVGGAYLLTRSMESLVQTSLPSVTLSWGPLVLGACLGMIVSLTATFVPAWRAGKISPLEGFRSVVRFDTRPIPWWATLVGLAMLAAGGGIIYAAGQGIISRDKLVTGGGAVRLCVVVAACACALGADHGRAAGDHRAG